MCTLTGPQSLLGMWGLGCHCLPTARCSCASTGSENSLDRQHRPMAVGLGMEWGGGSAP